jgi:cell division septation protein DedD
LAFCLAASVAFAGTAAAQDVQGGIAAWQAGDYAAAVAQWRPLADAGNADAQFNLGQAYRLGRGVAQNLNLAEQWFERAARQRHEQAGTSLGLLLFQNGRAREAMPWIQAAALRGDPRAQYVFGTALFNGDILRRDLPRAYAMMSAAAGQGFPQAQTQLAEMDRQLSPADRDRGRQLAAEMGSAPGPQMAAVQPSAPRVEPPASRRRPEAAPPSGPDAGISYTPPPEDRRSDPATRPAPPRSAPPRPVPPRVAPRATPRTTTTPTQTPANPVRTARGDAQGGAWRVQLGAFSSDANARRQWEAVRRRVSALGPLQPAYTRAGPLIRLRAGPVGSRAEADRLCTSVRAAGQVCIPVLP